MVYNKLTFALELPTELVQLNSLRLALEPLLKLLLTIFSNGSNSKATTPKIDKLGQYVYCSETDIRSRITHRISTVECTETSKRTISKATANQQSLNIRIVVVPIVIVFNVPDASLGTISASVPK